LVLSHHGLLRWQRQFVADRLSVEEIFREEPRQFRHRPPTQMFTVDRALRLQQLAIESLEWQSGRQHGVLNIK
jgi:hypothetical protein